MVAVRRLRPLPVGAPAPDGPHRRRLAAPLLDFVSALRGAIAAFGQGEVGTARPLMPRQVAGVAAALTGPLDRRAEDAKRLLYIGDFSPLSGVVDLLSCATQWAERHPAVSVEICWAGLGDLQGVLRAQLVPPNLRQSFPPLTDEPALVDLIGRCGILAVPNTGPVDPLPIALGMASGLPVLGSRRCPQSHDAVAGSAGAAACGWLFDPLVPQQMTAAFGAALLTPAAALHNMRQAARQHIAAMLAAPAGPAPETEMAPDPSLLAVAGQA